MNSMTPTAVPERMGEDGGGPKQINRISYNSNVIAKCSFPFHLSTSEILDIKLNILHKDHFPGFVAVLILFCCCFG